MALPYYGYDTKRYEVEYRGHRIGLIFNKKLLVLNRATLEVDDQEVDKERIFFGDHELQTRLDDGTQIRVEIGSGLVGELTKAVLIAEDGTAHPLSERVAAPSPAS